jgi:hypothetical protein
MPGPGISSCDLLKIYFYQPGPTLITTDFLDAVLKAMDLSGRWRETGSASHPAFPLLLPFVLKNVFTRVVADQTREASAAWICYGTSAELLFTDHGFAQ